MTPTPLLPTIDDSPMAFSLAVECVRQSLTNSVVRRLAAGSTNHPPFLFAVDSDGVNQGGIIPRAVGEVLLDEGETDPLFELLDNNPQRPCWAFIAVARDMAEMNPVEGTAGTRNGFVLLYADSTQIRAAFADLHVDAEMTARTTLSSFEAIGDAAALSEEWAIALGSALPPFLARTPADS